MDRKRLFNEAYFDKKFVYHGLHGELLTQRIEADALRAFIDQSCRAYALKCLDKIKPTEGWPMFRAEYKERWNALRKEVAVE